MQLVKINKGLAMACLYDSMMIAMSSKFPIVIIHLESDKTLNILLF